MTFLERAKASQDPRPHIAFRWWMLWSNTGKQEYRDRELNIRQQIKEKPWTHPSKI